MATTKKTDPKVTSVIARETDGNIQITFTIPYKLVQKAQDETVTEMSKDMVIPGFRKGTAPLSKVREKISQNSLIEHSLGHILPKALSDAINTEKLKPAIYPKFELIKAEENEPWQIRAITCELPKVEPGEYRKFVPGEIRAASLNKTLSNEEKEQTVIKSLVENVNVNIPKILIEEEADSRLSNLLSRLEKLGLALETYLTQVDKKPGDLRAEYATQAREAITLDLVLSKVAEEEGLKINEKELQEALKLSQTTNSTSGNPESQKRMIESILMRRKALDFLINLS